MTDRLHIVTTCSNRKRLPISAELRARELPSGSVDERFQEWRTRLADTTAPTVAARAVYAGEHWLQSERAALRAKSCGWHVDLWVASAGHGVISAARPVPAYAATLALRETDSVAGSGAEARAWWTAMTGLGVAPDAPRSFAELVRQDPRARFLLILSASYGDAMNDDLLLAASLLERPGDLTILSGGWQPPAALVDHHISYDASLQLLLGGARQSLNARTAAWVLGRTPPAQWDRAALRAEIASLASHVPSTEAPSRERMSDREVRGFVRAYIGREHNPSASRALRFLRDSGRACEQRRFGAIFRSELGVSDG